jgi:hypothetical protein
MDHWKSLSSSEQKIKIEQSRKILRASGAHYVVDDLRNIFPVLEDINARLAGGERP